MVAGIFLLAAFAFLEFAGLMLSGYPRDTARLFRWVFHPVTLLLPVGVWLLYLGLRKRG